IHFLPHLPTRRSSDLPETCVTCVTPHGTGQPAPKTPMPGPWHFVTLDVRRSVMKHFALFALLSATVPAAFGAAGTVHLLQKPARSEEHTPELQSRADL